MQEKTLLAGLTLGCLDNVLGKQAPGLGFHNSYLLMAATASDQHPMPQRSQMVGWGHNGPNPFQPTAPSWPQILGLTRVPSGSVYEFLQVILQFAHYWAHCNSDSPRSRPVPAWCQCLAQCMDLFPAFLSMQDSFGKNVLSRVAMTLAWIHTALPGTAQAFSFPGFCWSLQISSCAPQWSRKGHKKPLVNGTCIGEISFTRIPCSFG